MSDLILVDVNDNIVGTAEKMAVHKAGNLHRAFSAFIFRLQSNDLQVLLQKRQTNKYHSGGLWTNSCCGHPGIQETTISASQRRVTEELGINVELFELGTFIYKKEFFNGLVEHELDHVLFGIYQNDIITPDPNEVEDFKWVSILKFEDVMQKSAQEFTVWLPLAWEIVKDNFSKIKLSFEK